MKERPIIMGAESIRAILAGKKSQTRRIIKPRIYPTAIYEGFIDGQHQLYESRGGLVYRRNCPYGVPGDRLWVRETWRIMSMPEDPIRFQYKADMAVNEERAYEDCGWTCERYEQWYERQARKVQEDCDKAGLPKDEDAPGYNWTIETCPTRWQPSIHMPKFAARIWREVVSIRVERVQDITIADAIAEGYETNLRWPDPIDWFRDLWDSLNAKRGHAWSANDWVWVVSFKVVP